MMVTAEQPDLQGYCERVARDAAQASQEMTNVSGAVKNQWLVESALALRAAGDSIMQQNLRDIERAPEFGLSEAQVDRLKLDAGRIDGIAQGLQDLAAWPDPIGEIVDGSVRPNGLRLQRVRVPLGVVFFIYESRPNVTADAAGICVKSGNAVILRGGKEAAFSSQEIVRILREVGQRLGLPQQIIQLVETTDREAVGHFLSLDRWIDVAIPRGGEGLIRRVSAEANMPVIKHFSGNCHVFLDASAQRDMAIQLAVNSKCQRMGVCNAAESLLIHQAVADTLLPDVAAALVERNVELRGDATACRIVSKCIPATEEDYATEFLGPIMSLNVVASVQDAVRHINRYGSGHTDLIVTQDVASADYFAQRVDTAAVMVNASTRFHDGGEFGLGAEIGISTDKFHARGPCGLRELTSYKYVVRGDGQTR